MSSVISLLPPAGDPSGIEPLPMDQDDETRKVTVNQLRGPEYLPFAGARCVSSFGSQAAFGVGDSVPIEWELAEWDESGFFNIGEATDLVIPFTGVYDVVCNMAWETVSFPTTIGSTAGVQLVINGAATLTGQTSPCQSGFYTYNSFSCQRQFTAGDVVRIHAENFSDNSLPGVWAEVNLTRRCKPRTTPPPPDHLVFDEFIDDNGVSLADHVPEIGGPWTLSQGTWWIQDDDAVPNSTADNDQATIDATQVDIEINTQAVPQQDSSTELEFPGVVVRWIDTDNFHLAQLNVDLQKLQLYKKEGGVYTLLNEVDCPLVSGTGVEWTVRVVGDEFYSEVDGNEVTFSPMTFGLTSTICGIRVGLGTVATSSPIRFTYFQVDLVL